jgi:type IV pilus assembly protein PilN
MAKINLLPWRAERRVQRQREFYAMLGVAAIAGVVLSFLLWLHYDRQVSGQQVRNQFLETEIKKVEAQNEQIKELDRQKDRLLARKKVIEELQANRSQMVHLFDSLVRTVPDGLALANIKQEGEVLTLQGRAQSNARVSAYMRNLESSGWMTKPDLSIIEATPEDPKAALATGQSRELPYAFTLQVRLANPNAKTEEDGSVPADGAGIPVETEQAAPAAATAPATPQVAPAATAPAAPAPAASTTIAAPEPASAAPAN